MNVYEPNKHKNIKQLPLSLKFEMILERSAPCGLAVLKTHPRNEQKKAKTT